MEDRNGRAVILDPRRNQTIERKRLFEEMLLKELPGTSRPNEPMHAVLEGELGGNEVAEGNEAQNVRNHALIHYLATLANSNNTKDTFDFDFVESLLKNGADISSTDKNGQTVFHEVARSWNVDVAKFLIKHGANVNQQDQYGRSPLHVAAAVDYAEMVEFLLENGADIDIKTSGEGQTPIHFAAKNDAINSLQMLLGYGANIDARDSKNRTPLQVSAEMNRSKAAKHLIAEGAPAGVYDNLGNSALSLLIEKIPEVALDAMDQFHSVDTINRKEFYFLNYLEGTKLKEEKTPARTPLEIAVQNERFDIIMHPVMQRLIGVKWQMYGKWGAIMDLTVNLVYTILWTVLAVTLPNYGRDLYLPLAQNSWRLIIGILLILFTILEIRKQIVNTMKTRHELKSWREWRAAELERDLAYCHPRWPQEAQYLRAEIKAVRNLSLISGSDWWIYFDWASLVLILATIASHVTFFHYSNDTSKEVHHYILIPLLLILWFRIFKYARPFEGAGPFVVIFGHVLGDIVKWAFLNSIIVIPFTCAFWITFGAISLKPVAGYNSVGPLLYNIFSMMVVNDHSYEALEEANPVMARLLCGAFIGIAAIVTLNLLIALLSNTFERLYENAVANAVMQRARTILLLQKSLRKKQKRKYYDYIKNNGSPEVIVKTLGRLLMMDGDDRATIERVRDDVKVIVKILGEKFGRKFGKKGKKSDLDFVKMDVSKVRRFQEELMVDVKNMKQVLQEITERIEEMKSIRGKNNNNSSVSNDNENNNENNNDMKSDTNNNINIVSNGNTVGKPSTTFSLKTRKQSIKQQHLKKSRKFSQDYEDTEEETSETQTDSDSDDNDSDANNHRKKMWMKFKRNSVHSRKGSIFKGLSRKHQKDFHVDPEYKESQTTNQQLHSYPPHAQQSYPSYQYSQIQGNYIPPQHRLTASQSQPNLYQLPPENKMWIVSTPKESLHPQHQRSIIENEYLQRRQKGFLHESGQGQTQPNLNQYSALHTMEQQGHLYFNDNLPNTSAQPPLAQNTRSIEPSPYVKQSFPTSRSMQPQEIQNINESYGYYNYGFRSNDKYVNGDKPRGYNKRQFVQNTPALIQNKDFQASSTWKSTQSSEPRQPIRSQHVSSYTTDGSKNETKYPSTLMTPRTIHFDNQRDIFPQPTNKQLNHGAVSIIPQDSTQQVEYRSKIPEAFVRVIAPDEDKVLMTQVANQTGDQSSFVRDSLYDVKQEKPVENLKPNKIQIGEEQRTGSADSSILQRTSLQVSEEQNMSRNSPVTTFNVKNDSLLAIDQYSQYRPSTPLAPKISEKVDYFERKVDQDQFKESSKSGQQSEMETMSTQLSTDPVESHPHIDVEMDDTSKIFTDKISTNNDVSLSATITTNNTQVLEDEGKNEKFNNFKPAESLTAESTCTSNNLESSLQEDISPSILSQKVVDDQPDMVEQTPELDEEHKEMHPVGGDEEFSSEKEQQGLSEEIAVTVTGRKTGFDPNIGWV